jgi:predicted nucleic acid-binding protein
MVVVDTSVVAFYFFANEPFANRAHRFWTKAARTSTRIIAPAIWEQEITAAIQNAVTAGVLPLDEAVPCLCRAQRLAIESVPTSALWESALQRSVSSRLSVRDALFVQLAVRHGGSLVTFDEHQLRAFPSIAVAPQ